ncbi:hypothetical protein RFZ32_19285, partial [Acinetobacter baumannii]|nr:hypothetical protein [Acinetobacter baumannii]
VMKWTVANDQIWLDRSDKNFVDYAKSIAKNSTGAIATNLLLYGVLKAAQPQANTIEATFVREVWIAGKVVAELQDRNGRLIEIALSSEAA